MPFQAALGERQSARRVEKIDTRAPRMAQILWLGAIERSVRVQPSCPLYSSSEVLRRLGPSAAKRAVTLPTL